MRVFGRPEIIMMMMPSPISPRDILFWRLKTKTKLLRRVIKTLLWDLGMNIPTTWCCGLILCLYIEFFSLTGEESSVWAHP